MRPLQMTLRNGRRCSAATAFLRPAMKRSNLTIKTGVLVTRIAMEGSRAVGVEYVQNGQTELVRANREIILAGGAINSPQLLMLSGIGHPDELKVHGIEARIALKGVGKNLRDHTSAALTFRRKQTSPFQRNMRLDRVALALAQAYLLGTASPPTCRSASPRSSRPDRRKWRPTCRCCSGWARPTPPRRTCRRSSGVRRQLLLSRHAHATDWSGI